MSHKETAHHVDDGGHTRAVGLPVQSRYGNKPHLPFGAGTGDSASVWLVRVGWQTQAGPVKLTLWGSQIRSRCQDVLVNQNPPNHQITEGEEHRNLLRSQTASLFYAMARSLPHTPAG